MRASASLRRYQWASNLARAAMGTRKVWGEPPRHNADDDPLAWWVLTEAIAEGGPPRATSPSITSRA